WEIQTNIVDNEPRISSNRVVVAYGLSQIHLKKHCERLWYVLDKKYAKRYTLVNKQFLPRHPVGISIALHNLANALPNRNIAPADA
ncbi:MAG: hypothetical protein LRY51_12820, partial [Geovibrio sp.]|nr:hypothetical protein [Geovibrio sp.]